MGFNWKGFDGKSETAIFPGDLPKNPDSLFQLPQDHLPVADPSEMRFVRFRPPALEQSANGITLSLPHIRLDRALQFLIGDYLA